LQKSRTYSRVKFDAKTIPAGDEELNRLGSTKRRYRELKVLIGDDEWVFDTLAEFLAAITQCFKYYFYVTNSDGTMQLQVNYYSGLTTVWVLAPERAQIERIFSVFDSEAERCRLPEIPPEKQQAKVFIGHGANAQWKDLKDHLHEKHGYEVEAYEIGSRAGHTIRDVLEEMLDKSSFALLVMTGEDETKDGKVHARQNVVHEAGLFQGRLGFSRAIVLLEQGTEEFSNIAGIQQIRSPKETSANRSVTSSPSSSANWAKPGP
jgi:hypothetical protein